MTKTEDLLAQLPIDEREIIVKRMLRKGTNIVSCWGCGRIMEAFNIRVPMPLCAECSPKRFAFERLPLSADVELKRKVLFGPNSRPGKNWKSKYER